MSAKLGPLLKDARIKAGFTQQQLADKITGLSASDISKAERNEKELTQEQLKTIARLTGVTQKSLLEAAGKKSSSKTTSSKTGTSSKKTSSTTSKTTSATSSMKLTATEKKLVELYRKADSDTKREAMEILKGKANSSGDILSGILGQAMEALMK